MADTVVLVNSLPSSGKTTLATALAPVRGLPLITKDRLKEAIRAAAPDLPPAGIGPADVGAGPLGGPRRTARVLVVPPP
jgi:predicted kinase